MLRKMVAVFPKYQWIWGLPSPRSEWDLATQQKWEAISTFVEEVEASLVSGCDAEQINTQLDRIATALESLDAKTQELVDLDDIIDGIEGVLGVTNIWVELLRWFRQLFPDIVIKVPLGELIMGFWNYVTWRAPLLQAVGAMVGAQSLMAIASVGQGAWSMINGQFSLLQGWILAGKDFILGDWSVWDDFIKPLWEIFVPDSEGGTGGTDPDADPDLRIYTRITLDNDYTEAISDNIEAFRTTFETRSVAETVGQNTNFSDLIAALNSMNLTLEQQADLANAIEDVLGGTYEPT
jgi:hypothetical protein